MASVRAAGTVALRRQRAMVALDPPIARVAAPLRKSVIEFLRVAITSFEYQPGERLLEADLCRRFGVSRTVVREALRHLEAERLVDIVPNQGPVVARVTAADARALYEVREALESTAAMFCAVRATDADKRDLREAFRNVEVAYRKGVLAEQIKVKDRFYAVLFRGARNDLIASMHRIVQARASLLRAFSLQSGGRRDESLKELRALTAAIQRGDSRSAHRLATQHVRAAAATALAALARDRVEPEPGA